MIYRTEQARDARKQKRKLSVNQIRETFENQTNTNGLINICCCNGKKCHLFEAVWDLTEKTELFSERPVYS